MKNFTFVKDIRLYYPVHKFHSSKHDALTTYCKPIPFRV